MGHETPETEPTSAGIVRVEAPVRRMTLDEFDDGLKGEPTRLPDGRSARHVVAEALREYAKTIEKSQAARLRYIAGKAECGIDTGKSMRAKVVNHIRKVREQIRAFFIP